MRHADAGDRATWTGDDSLRPLSELGRRQSSWLVEQLASFNVSRLFTSPYVRCVQSLEPLSASLRRPIVKDAQLAEGEDADYCLTLLSEPGTVACTHGDVVEATLVGFRRRGIRIEGGDAAPKGGLWIVEGARVQLVRPPK